jgi:hypothetical protein
VILNCQFVEGLSFDSLIFRIGEEFSKKKRRNSVVENEKKKKRSK